MKFAALVWSVAEASSLEATVFRPHSPLPSSVYTAMTVSRLDPDVSKKARPLSVGVQRNHKDFAAALPACAGSPDSADASRFASLRRPLAPVMTSAWVRRSLAGA